MNRREFVMQSTAAAIWALIPVARTLSATEKLPLRTYTVPQTELAVSRIAYGCSRLVGWYKEPPNAATLDKADRIINTAYDQGINLFDLADGYGFGHTEAAFGTILKRTPGLRNNILIQSKCGGRGPNSPLPLDSFAMDLSRAHIIAAAEGSLNRLQTDHLDILLLHGPDALVQPQEVAEAFDHLKRNGKVRYFGVCNHTPGQIELLKQAVSESLVVNQLPLGLPRPRLIADDLLGSAMNGTIVSNGTLDYCRRNAIQVQAYSPLRGDLMRVPSDAGPEVKRIAEHLADLAREKNTNPSAVVLAWLLHHPAGIVPIIGSTNPEHIAQNCAADRVTLSRSEWYGLLNLALTLPPQKVLTPNAD